MTASMLVVWSFLAAFGQMRSWRALAACVLLLAAAALPYAQATGSPVGYVVNVTFVILAVIAALFALRGWRLRTE